MARMARSNIYPRGSHDLPPMPAVCPELLAQHDHTLKARLEAFPENQEETIKIKRDSAMDPDTFRHQLRYDAESVFWCLLWWCIQAKPAGKLPEEPIPHNVWSILVGISDMRGSFIYNFPMGYLHSRHSKLATLLDGMCEHLQGDLSFSKDKERRENPEYIHEVFQRLILNLLIANCDEEFMDTRKEKEPRDVEKTGMERAGSTQPSKKSGGAKRSLQEVSESPAVSEVSTHRPQSSLAVYSGLPITEKETTARIGKGKGLSDVA